MTSAIFQRPTTTHNSSSPIKTYSFVDAAPRHRRKPIAGHVGDGAWTMEKSIYHADTEGQHSCDSIWFPANINQACFVDDIRVGSDMRSCGLHISTARACLDFTYQFAFQSTGATGTSCWLYGLYHSGKSSQSCSKPISTPHWVFESIRQCGTQYFDGRTTWYARQ